MAVVVVEVAVVAPDLGAAICTPPLAPAAGTTPVMPTWIEGDSDRVTRLGEASDGGTPPEVDGVDAAADAAAVRDLFTVMVMLLAPARLAARAGAAPAAAAAAVGEITALAEGDEEAA